MRRYLQDGVLPGQPQYQQADGADGAGRPGLFGRDLAARRRASTSWCQCSTVYGRTSSRNRPSTSCESRCTSAARNIRHPTGWARTRRAPIQA